MAGIKRRRRGPATPSGTYTEWFWPPSTSFARTLLAGYKSFEHTLLPEIDPGPDSSYYWAHQFRIIGGEGGYLGLQSTGNRADGSVGKTAIFSIWDALEAVGPGAMRFSGEGSGWSARIPYPWQPGRPYSLRVSTPGGGWWAAAVRDDVTGQVTEIGGIRVPEPWRQLDSWSVMWTEYFGPPLATCADLAHSSVVFSRPLANGEVKPAGSHNRVNEGTCDTSRISVLPEGVRHEMGLPA